MIPPNDVFSPLGSIALIRDDVETRLISAENPDGRKGGGARAELEEDANCTNAASELGKGWKVRPCISIGAGETVRIAEIDGPGVVQHIWITVDPSRLRYLALRVYYADCEVPSVECPLGDFFANGLDGLAYVNSMVIAVNPRGGMNSYWPMPFRKKIRIEVTNDGPIDQSGFFYQITYALGELTGDDMGYFHAQWRRGMTSRKLPEHVILDGVKGCGQYVGTYLVWNQLSNEWWGEGEVKFFIDGDKKYPTICGTGTEDYFGGAWGFRANENPETSGPVTFSTPFLGYPQAVYRSKREQVPAHALYRWHIPDPIRFRRELRMTIQALGWYPTEKYQPLTDDIASTAIWYQDEPAKVSVGLPGLNDRLPR